MARTKRKINPITTEKPPLRGQEPQRYRAAGYARLSVEDSGRPGAETIEAQKQMISDYIESSTDTELLTIYCDNGETGTDFHRPGFEAMMKAVGTGSVNCIVVKDLSRFGRNYIETGNYIERIFPLFGLRFISINDCYDTLTADPGVGEYIVPLKNIINETYSRDISRKTSSALQTKQQKGEFLGTWAPYGYSRSKEDKHYLVPNPETAPVVQRIFRMRMEGASYRDIAEAMNAEGICSPSRYLWETGLCRNPSYARSIWKPNTVRSILYRQVYLGHMIQGVKRRSFFAGERLRCLPKENQTIVRNTHAPIINADDFAAVQTMAKDGQRTEKEATRTEYRC